MFSIMKPFIYILFYSLFTYSNSFYTSKNKITQYRTNGIFDRTFIFMKTKKNGDIGNNIFKRKQIYFPRGDNQQKYLDLLENSNTSIVVGTGPAGSGKTLFACNTAINALRAGHIDKIIITRPIISVDDEELGFLPGTLVKKMDPWTRPILDVIGEFYSKIQIQSLIQNGVIEISPLAYMRGRTFKRSFIIADEMQNSSPNQMLMMLTRIGEDSKLVITGDQLQSDRKGVNGLQDLIQKINHKNDTSNSIRIVFLNTSDVQRNPVVKQILDIYHPQITLDRAPPIPSQNISHKNHTSTKTNSSTKNHTSTKKNIPKRSNNDDAALIPKSHITRRTIF